MPGPRCYHRQRTVPGQRDWLSLLCRTLSFPIPSQFIPALSPSPSAVRAGRPLLYAYQTANPMHGETQELAAMPAVMAAHGIELPREQVDLLTRYCQQLWTWNRQLNLTRHTTSEKFVSRDLTDTLRLAELLERRQRVLDVGTGGGVPGIPLAIIRPDLKVSLAESVAKKARAVEQIVAALSLPATVHHARAEDLLRKHRYETLIVRAVAPLPKLLGWFSNRWRSFGRLLVIKGPSWIDERADARHRGLLHNLELRKAAEYPIPGSDNRSVILQIRPKVKR